MRYFLRISYRGTHFAGWQKQGSKRTVQLVMEQQLSTLLRMPVEATGCGRTDSGVHARQFYLHFDADKLNGDQFIHRLNRMLPDDVGVHALIPVESDAHARFDAFKRSYRYCMHTVRNPFLEPYSYYFPFSKLDTELMKSCAAMLVNYEDFEPLCKTGSDIRHTRCDMHSAQLHHDQHRIWLDITANRFLRGMVRRIVGVLLAVGTGRLTLSDFDRVMQSRKKFRNALAAPAQGLFLMQVAYPFLQSEFEPVVIV